MKKQINKYGLRVGDLITFFNLNNYKVVKMVTRTEAKSCYTDNKRESWNTINSKIEEFNAIITRSETLDQMIEND